MTRGQHGGRDSLHWISLERDSRKPYLEAIEAIGRASDLVLKGLEIIGMFSITMLMFSNDCSICRKEMGQKQKWSVWLRSLLLVPNMR